MFSLSSSFSSIPTTLLVLGNCLLILGIHILKVLQAFNLIWKLSIPRNAVEGTVMLIQCAEFTKRKALKKDQVTDGSDLAQCRFYIHQRSSLKQRWDHLQMVKYLQLLYIH